MRRNDTASRPKNFGVKFAQTIPAFVAVAVAGSTVKMADSYLIIFKGSAYFNLIKISDIFYRLKFFF